MTMPHKCIALMACLAALSCAQTDPEPEPVEDPSGIEFRIDGDLDIVRSDGSRLSLAIEIADTDSLRTRGMMERTVFPDRTGMLFVFDVEEVQQFWMGNTPLSLDLVFISADSQIVDVAANAVPYSDDPIISRAPAQYVLEIPGGYADEVGILEGDRAVWRRR